MLLATQVNLLLKIQLQCKKFKTAKGYNKEPALHGTMGAYFSRQHKGNNVLK